MAGNLTIQQPRNPIVDIADIVNKLAPTLFGSGETRASQQIDPSVAANSDRLQALLTQRGSSTAQADQVIQDILYRAQLAFAPVLGDEKRSGLYNSTVKRQMANEAVARATAASAQAVMEDQQRALAQATALQQSRNAGSKNSSQKTGPQVSAGAILKNTALGMGASAVLKKGIGVAKDIYSQITAPGKGIDSGPYADASDNLYNPDDFSSSFDTTGGAFDPMHTAGDFGPANFDSGAQVPGANVFTADDTQALQQIIDSTTIPTGGTQIAAADTGTVSDTGTPLLNNFAPSGAIQDPSGVSVSSMFAPEDLASAGINFDSAETLGPIATQKAIEEGGATVGGDPFALAAQGADPLDASFELSGQDLFAEEVGGPGAIEAGSSVGTDAGASLGGGVPYLAIGQGTVNTLENPELNLQSSALGGPVGLSPDIVDTASNLAGKVGDAIGDLGDSISDTIDDASIICTELRRQGKLRWRWFILGLKEFRTYDALGKRGYYYWAHSVVRHLQSSPNSFFSRFIERLFNIRAEYVAARHGDRTAQRTLLGAIVDRGMYGFCWILSRTLARGAA